MDACVKSCAFFVGLKSSLHSVFRRSKKIGENHVVVTFVTYTKFPTTNPSINFSTSMIDHESESDHGISDARHRIKTRVAVRSPHSQTSISLIDVCTVLNNHDTPSLLRVLYVGCAVSFLDINLREETGLILGLDHVSCLGLILIVISLTISKRI